ncbi:MAG: hypothetical protein L6R38_009393 [Xanthoria sp. 2 TBL-2021]|nr:MAG: hypothetical protein L6R38_009393 [Xanthoria sp. 2 TBL-2021]
MSPKRALSPTPFHPSAAIYRSSSITDRSSRFTAIYSPSLTAKQLQSRPEVSDATHRITASRTPSTQRSLTPSQQPFYTTTHSDDGEKYAGKALASVLSDLNAEGSIIVARWYGGIMLGPVRFEHIKNCAREALSKHLNSTQQQQSQVKKARTVTDDDEEKRRADLIRVLPERDRSISVLRGLLVEKHATESSSLKEEKVASPAKVPEYSKLPLKTLENLERARDATIGWILAQIEKAEIVQQAEAPQEAEVAEKTKVASDAG